MRSLVAVLGVGLFLLVGCAAPAPPALTGASLATSLRASGLPVTQIDVATAESDSNHLLGRPNQYTGKINWHDTRLADDMGATVEVFTSAADLESRFKYTDAISSSGGAFAQYIYRNDKKLLLLRLPHELTPTQAEEYKTWLGTL